MFTEDSSPAHLLPWLVSLPRAHHILSSLQPRCLIRILRIRIPGILIPILYFSTMRWPWQSEPQTPKKPIPWADSLNATNWQHYTSPETIVPTILLTGTILAGVRVYRLYLRRIPATSHVAPGFYRKRSLFGTVTRVGDGDNFHLYHTPGGRLTGWGWIRRVPEKAGELKRRTVSCSDVISKGLGGQG